MVLRIISIVIVIVIVVVIGRFIEIVKINAVASMNQNVIISIGINFVSWDFCMVVKHDFAAGKWFGVVIVPVLKSSTTTAITGGALG